MKHLMNIIFVIFCILMVGCSGIQSISDNTSNLEDNVCPIPDDSGKEKENHLKRAAIFLSAITGFAYRNYQVYSIDNQSLNDEATRTISYINKAWSSIKEANERVNSTIFPIERADYIVDILYAAESAIRPSVKNLINLPTSSSAQRLSAGKNILVKVIMNGLYKKAYSELCENMTDVNIDDIKERIANRCNDIKSLSSSSLSCEIM